MDWIFIGFILADTDPLKYAQIGADTNSQDQLGTSLKMPIERLY